MKFSCINQQRARELYKKVKSVLLSIVSNLNSRLLTTFIGVRHGRALATKFWIQIRCYHWQLSSFPMVTVESLSMTFTADGKRQRLPPIFFFNFLVILQ